MKANSWVERSLILFFFEELKKMKHKRGYSCSFSDWEIYSCKDTGLQSKIFFLCQKCEKKLELLAMMQETRLL